MQLRRLQETTITIDVSPPQPAPTLLAIEGDLASTLLAIEDGQPGTPPPLPPPRPPDWENRTVLDDIIDGIDEPPGPPSPVRCPPPQHHALVFGIPSAATTWMTFEAENGDCDYNTETGELRRRAPTPPPLTFGVPRSTGTSSMIPFNGESGTFYYDAETGEMRPETTHTPSPSPSRTRERHAWPSPAEPSREDAELNEELTKEEEDLMQVKEEEEEADSIPSTLTEPLSKEDQDELKDESIVRQNAEPFA